MQNIKNIMVYVLAVMTVLAFFILLNFFSVSVADDKNMILILRSLGISKKGLLKIYLPRSIVIALLYIISASIGTSGVLAILNPYFITKWALVFTPLVIDFLTIGLIAVTTILIVMIATIVPVMKVIKGRLSRVGE